MKNPSRKALRILQVLLGTMDCLTGLLLMVAPVWTVKLMGIRSAVEWPVMLSWVGAFVFAVGLTYFLVGWGDDEEGWRTQWRMSAVVRMVIGVFVVWKLVSGELEMAWLTVALTDLVVAGMQMLGLRWGWLGRKEAR